VELHTFPRQADGVYSLDWSPDSTYLATGGTDGVIHVWNALAVELLQIIQTDLMVRSVAWSPDGTQLAYGAANGTVQIVPAPAPMTCDFTVAAGDAPALISAINTANGNGVPDTLCLTNSTYTLTTVNNTSPSGLPIITTSITILGNGATITRDPAAPNFRILKVDYGGSLTLENVTLSGGYLNPYDGGAYGAKNASEGRNVSRRFSKIRVKDASKPIMTMHIAS
jgi:WD40 repeat protein